MEKLKDQMSAQMKSRREGTYVVTMIGAIDLIGELNAMSDGSDFFVELKHPHFLRMTSPTQCTLAPMLKGSQILSGTSIMVNLRNTLWICEPSKRVLDEYTCARSGILKATTSFPDKAVNQ
jgi:hypothetical protein